MESVGLAVGIAGLAGLFTTCVECFNIVQQGRYFGHDYWILEAKYANQRLRLLTWGRACGLADADGFPSLPWDDHVSAAVEGTLQRMAALFQDQKALHNRYGLCIAERGSTRSTASAIFGSLASKLQIRTSGLIRAQSELPWPSFSRGPALPATVRWAVQDKKKFADLVQHLKDFNDDLETLTAGLNVFQRQRDLIREEVSSIVDVEELETIETARMGVRDPVADAASLRLFQLQEEGQPITEPPERHGADSSEPPTTTGLDPNDQTWEILDPPAPSIESQEDVPYQVLHRVLCDTQPTTIFFDEPSYQTTSGTDGQWLVIDSYSPLRDPTPLHLSGRRPLHNTKAHLEQNGHLAFLVFKEYKCSHDTDTARTAESTQSGIYLVSDALCSALNSINLKADPPVFRPGMELRSPYEWFYHNRALLAGVSHLGLSSDNDDKNNGNDEDDKDSEGNVDDEDDMDAHSLKEAGMLLDCIRICSSNTYEQFQRSMRTNKTVKWEHLPLLFPSNGVVIEPNSMGDGEDLAFVQLGPVQFAHNRDNAQQEVVEITVTDSLDRWTAEPLDSKHRRIRKLYIPRSLFGESRQEAAIRDLPAYPFRCASRGKREDIVDRGRLYDCLRDGTHEVWYEPDRSEGFAAASEPVLPRMARVTNGVGITQPLDHYMIDCATYEALHRPYPSLRRRLSTLYNPDNIENLEWSEVGLEQDRQEAREMALFDWDMERYLPTSEMGPKERRFYACQPHIIYGFHLRDHVWRKLLVNHVSWVDRERSSIQLIVLGEFLERLLAASQDLDVVGLPIPPHKRPAQRVLITVRGPEANEAIDAISAMVDRPTYRVRISTEGEAASADNTLRQAASLATMWGCIVVMEDLFEAYHLRGHAPGSLDATVAPVLRFLDTFGGVVIFALRNQDLELDPRIGERVCGDFQFGHEDASPASRRAVWKHHITRCTYRFSDPEGEKQGPDAKGHLDRLAEFDLSWKSIRSIVDAVVGVDGHHAPVNWELLMEVAEKRTSKVVAPPPLAPRSEVSP